MARRNKGAGRGPVVGTPIGTQERQPKKEPGLEFTDDGQGLQPCWDFSLMDDTFTGEWDWDLSAQESSKLFSFLKGIQTCSWREIQRQDYNGAGGYRKKLHHPMPAESLSAEAKNRLHELKLGDIEEVFRFRLGSDIRLWAVFLGHMHRCYLLWWDRGHRVYPLDD